MIDVDLASRRRIPYEGEEKEKVVRKSSKCINFLGDGGKGDLSGADLRWACVKLSS
jgi:hypothetical protein